MKDREFDIVVYGATGFTGRLVAEYLLERYGTGGDLKWAVAGRSPGKLDALRNELGEAAADLPSVVADSGDAGTLAALAARTRVVLTTVGPYALYGSQLVAACVDAGTDYCDLAGEVQWIRAMIDRHHEQAQQTGARIVHCCGFDSIPMDIGAWFLQQEAHQRFGSYCKSIKLYVKATKGAVSGGTVASMSNVARTAREDRSILRLLVDPYALNPEGERDGPDGRDQQGSVFDEATGSWTAPFIMASVNTRVVRRSHALAGYPWGQDFCYGETVLTGKGLGGRAKAALVSGGLAGLALGLAYAPTRALLRRVVLPDPGEGPDRKQRESGFFNLMQLGTLPDGKTLRGRITGDRDPGYGSTSKMLAEAAVCLALDNPESPGGVLTPAAAMAAPLIERLRGNAGLTFDIVD
ncbi:MAG: saccharopine dehydrogenase NADP-binding domain-containing protein [Gammaproteobacteria bacterium]|nr:saccharopine dehydrogenase NADP-binding domain-containing protein [Gammaproteobacteria bacterium]MBT8106218.1 saccharopine dehydrogenase NADP-binding domain-containing protein [Gammaproteobacteria bacterium]NNK26232.1 saccharopine dehydrogenase [Woeseiaceae bacterium]NNL63135.1 saccharopine dehydrogenase [Woeseiaceae bacterium]